MARRRGLFRKKSTGGRRRRRIRSNAADDDGGSDRDYVAEEDEDEETERSYESDVSPRGSSDEESFQFSESDEEEVAAPKRRRSSSSSSSAGRAGSKKRRKRPMVSDEDEIEEDVSVLAPRRKRRVGGSGRRRNSMPQDPEDDDDDDEDFSPGEEEYEEEISPVASKRRKLSGNKLGRKQKSEEEYDEEISPVAGKKKKLSGNKLGRKQKSDAHKTDVRKRKKSADAISARKRERRPVEVSDEDDFIVEESTDRRRKKSKKASSARRRAKKDAETSDSDFIVSEDDSVANVLSDSDFVVSDDDDFVAKGRDRVVINGQQRKSRTARKKDTVPKRRKKRRSGDSDSSDSDYVISDDEVRDLVFVESPKVPQLKRISTGEKEMKEKGKEKIADDSEKQVCGICLTEEQKATVRGLLNCCSHYFCFVCIMEWSKVESKCPLCKRRFVTISKSSRSDPGFGLRKAVIRVQKRDQVYQPSEEEVRGLVDPYEGVVCMVCQHGGHDNLMLLCDICDSPAHTYCVGLGREVPEGNWYCDGCRFVDDGSSNSQLPDMGIDQGTSSSDLFSGGIEAEDLSKTMVSRAAVTNSRQSASFPAQTFPRRIDLNASPRHLSVEDHGVASHASVASVSTPSATRGPDQPRRVLLSDISTRQAEDLLTGSSNLQFHDTAEGRGSRSSNFFSGGPETLNSNIGIHPADSRSSLSFPGQPSSQFDLNVSPQHLSGEDRGVTSHASGAGAATLSGRRAIHRRIRFLLSTSGPGRTDMPSQNVEANVMTSEVEKGRQVLHASEAMKLPQTMPATEGNRQTSRHVLQSNASLSTCTSSEGSGLRQVEGAKEQIQSMVKHHLKKLSRGIPVERETFKEIARRSTHTILAACGIEHNRRMVTDVPSLNNCSHDLNDGVVDLVKGCCSACFSSFVKAVVQKLLDAAQTRAYSALL